MFRAAKGADLSQAAHIRSMHGAYRLPDRLKELDQLTKEPEA